MTAVAVMAFSALATAQVAVSPAQPTMLDTVRLQVTSSGPQVWDIDRTRITMSGNVIDVTLRSGPLLDPAPPTRTDQFFLGQFPVGSYTVTVQRDNGFGPVELLGSVAFDVTPKPAPGGARPLWDFSDLWWNPQQSGWGLNVIQHASGNLFVTWFAYRADGAAFWYVVPGGTWTQGRMFRGDVYWTSGPVVGDAFDPSAVKAMRAGTATLQFDTLSPDAGIFTLQFDDGLAWSSPIVRQAF